MADTRTKVKLNLATPAAPNVDFPAVISGSFAPSCDLLNPQVGYFTGASLLTAATNLTLREYNRFVI